MSDNECSGNEDKTPGIFSWHELMTSDLESSRKFYTDLLGWSTEEVEMPGGTYTMFMAGDRPVAGVMQPPKDACDGTTKWVGYITVEDIQSTVKKAVSLGAKICLPVTEIPGKGSFAGLTDPQGAPVAFWEFAS